MILNLIRELVGFPSIYTQDGEHYATGGGTSWRIRNLFVEGNPVDCTINLSGTLMPTSTSFNNGTGNFKPFILISASVSAIDGTQNVLPIYVNANGIWAILDNGVVERFNLSGASMGTTNLNIVNSISPNFIINNKSIGFQNVNGKMGVVIFGSYGTNPANGNFVVGSQAKFNINAMPIDAGFITGGTFPTSLIIPSHNLFVAYNAIQMNSYGADCYCAFANFTTGITVILPIAYLAQDCDSQITASSTYAPDNLPIDFPVDYNNLTIAQSAIYSGYGDAINGASVWVEDAVAQSIFQAARAECYLNARSVFTTNTVDLFPLIYYTTDNETDTLSINENYSLNNETVSFSLANQNSFFLCATGNIGIIAQATNGKYYYVSTGDAPPPPVTGSKKYPKMFSVANYSKLI